MTCPPGTSGPRGKRCRLPRVRPGSQDDVQSIEVRDMAEVVAEIVAEETELLRVSKLEKRQEGAENEGGSGLVSQTEILMIA